MSSSFDKNAYNHNYYLKNKEKLDQKRLDNYYKNKGFKSVSDYVNNHLDNDMIFIRDELMKTNEDDPTQREHCIELMKSAKYLLLLKSLVLNEDESEIKKIVTMRVQ